MAASPYLLFALAPILTAALTAQIEPGWGVIGSAYNSVQTTNPGIWTFDPVHGNFLQLATPPGWTPSGNGGVYSTLVRDADGAIVAGTIAWGTPLEIGVKVGGAPWVIYTLGTASPGPVSDMKWLPDGRVVFCYYGLMNANYGLSSSGLAILDLSLPPTNPAAIQQIPATGLPIPLNALAVDPGGQSLYVGLSGPSSPANIYEVPLAGGPATLQATQSAGIADLFFDYQGRLIVGTLGAGLLAYNTTTWTSTVCQSYPYCGGCLDPTTGALLIVHLNPVTIAGVMEYGTCGAPPTMVPGFTAANIAALGLDVRASINEFDPPPTPHPFGWQITPNPSGAARIGNTNFSLTVTGPAAPGMAFVGLGLGRVPPSVLPPAHHVLLDWLQPTAWSLHASSATPFSVPIAIPPSIVSRFELYAQVFAPQAGAWQGSSGLWIHVF